MHMHFIYIERERERERERAMLLRSSLDQETPGLCTWEVQVQWQVITIWGCPPYITDEVGFFSPGLTLPCMQV